MRVDELSTGPSDLGCHNLFSLYLIFWVYFGDEILFKEREFSKRKRRGDQKEKKETDMIGRGGDGGLRQRKTGRDSFGRIKFFF